MPRCSVPRWVRGAVVGSRCWGNGVPGMVYGYMALPDTVYGYMALPDTVYGCLAL